MFKYLSTVGNIFSRASRKFRANKQTTIRRVVRLDIAAQVENSGLAGNHLQRSGTFRLLDFHFRAVARKLRETSFLQQRERAEGGGFYFSREFLCTKNESSRLFPAASCLAFAHFN